jgi:hypothetical protein
MAHLTRVTLHLARNPHAGFPDGDERHGYVLMAPLDRDGRLDSDLWRAHRAACTVRRFTPGHDNDADGWLTHRGSSWRLRYDEDDEGPDEGLHRLGEHTLRLGDYVTVEDPDGPALVYRVGEAVEVLV